MNPIGVPRPEYRPEAVDLPWWLVSAWFGGWMLWLWFAAWALGWCE